MSSRPAHELYMQKYKKLTWFLTHSLKESTWSPCLNIDFRFELPKLRGARDVGFLPPCRNPLSEDTINLIPLSHLGNLDAVVRTYLRLFEDIGAKPDVGLGHI